MGDIGTVLYVLAGNFTIDYPTKRIVFRAAPVVGASAPFQDTAPGLIVQMEVDGVPLHLILDTGASGMLLFQSRIRDRLPQLTGLGERDVIKLGRRLSVPERASSSNASWGHGFRSTERLRRGRSGGQQPRVRWTARPFRRWTQANRSRFPASYVFVEKVGSRVTGHPTWRQANRKSTVVNRPLHSLRMADPGGQ